MLDVTLCEKLAAEFNDALVSDADLWAFDHCFPPLAEELGRDTAGALDFLRGLPLEQFEQIVTLACALVDSCTGSKVAYADGLYELAKERGADETTLRDVNNGRIYAAQ